MARRKPPETTQPERRQLSGRKPTGSQARGSIEMRFRASPRMSARLRELAQENGRGVASFVRWQLAQSLKISE